MSRLEITSPNQAQLMIEELYKTWNAESNPVRQVSARLT